MTRDSPPSTHRATAGIARVSGLRLEEDDWIGPDGRRTAIAEAVLWALLRIAIGSE